MLPGLEGSLVSTAIAEQVFASGHGDRLGELARQRARRWMVRWWQRSTARLGPASSVRALFDEAAVPLFGMLGFGLAGAPVVVNDRLLALLDGPHVTHIPVVVGRWSSSLPRLRTDAVRLAARPDIRWCLAFCGHHLAIIDTHRTYARAFLQFDLESAVDDDLTFALLWTLLRAQAFSIETPGAPVLVEELANRSERHRVTVCDSLHRGVLVALTNVIESFAAVSARGQRTATDDLGALLEQALGIVYRILFLLFAEARRLVPTWHPTYRDGYTIEALRDAVSRSATAPHGAWEALAAISRLAASGCATPDLSVTAFNGDLFGQLPVLRHAIRLDGTHAAAAITALSTTTVGGGPRRPIAYGELGVEQLGAVYETVLDYRPSVEYPSTRDARSGTGQTDDRSGSGPAPTRPTVGGRVVLERTGGARKATGTYYTPRAVTDYLVRRALGPLTRGATPAHILGLRVVDPAMGSGAFLVSACRYLAAAYEDALVRAGDCSPNDIDDGERAQFRRTIAQRCLYGVDRNPMAVQLARLSLWLTTLAADRPLTFLNHHLRVGDSLVGASPDDLLRQPPGPSRRAHGPLVPLPLFDQDQLAASIDPVSRQLRRIANEPGDSLDDVRWKHRALERLFHPDSPLGRWRTIVDLWCASWFWPDAAPPPPRAFPDLIDFVMTGRSALPPAQAADWLDRARRTSAESGFFHWRLEFPEAFYDESGLPLPRPGFDAGIGNPPWNMVRADTGSTEVRDTDRHVTRQLVRFCRQSGVYTASASGHANLYQLFLDRTLNLVREGGTVGMVAPAGLLSDHGSATLRRRLLASSTVDAIVGFDNRDGIFPIHRGLKFVAISARLGQPTERIPCRFRERDPAVLDAISDETRPSAGPLFPVVLTRELIERISGPDLTIPELCNPVDVAIADGAHRRWPRLGSVDGWSVKLGRELNASDDRRLFTQAPSGLPVLEGKQIGPFTVDAGEPRYRVDRRLLEARFGPDGSFTRARLAYRDVAASTNRLTLIAAMLPAEVVTTHTLFCVRSSTPLEIQWFLCGILNSYVANYLVRLTVGTHVTLSRIEGLPVPVPPIGSMAFRAVASGSRRLARSGGGHRRNRALLQARVALLYGVDHDELEHILQTFPLVPRVDREATSTAFGRLSAGC